MRFVCPGCNKTLEAHDDWAGQPYECSGCGQRMRVPANIVPTDAFQDRDPLPPPPAVRGRDDDDRDRYDERDDGGYRDRRRRDRHDERDADPYYERPRRREQVSSGLSVTGMVLGIVSIPLMCFPVIPWILGALGIIFGAIGLNTNHPSARGMAITGIACGAVGILAGLVFFIMLLTSNGPFWGRRW
jgi:hypothetical protein